MAAGTHADLSAYPPLDDAGAGDPAAPGSQQLPPRPPTSPPPPEGGAEELGGADSGISDSDYRQDLTTVIGTAATATAFAAERPDPVTDEAHGRRRVAKSFVKRYRRGGGSEALGYGEERLAADPANDRLRYALAIALLDEGGRVADARELLVDLDDGPYAARAHAALGSIALAERDYGSARRHLAHAYRLDPKADRELAYRLGALLQDEFPEKRRAARRYLREATRRSKRNASDAWYRLGKLDARRGKWKRAARAFKTAASLDRAHPFAAYDLAALYLERGRLARAHRYFRRAVRANPEVDTLANRQAFAPPTPELESDGFDRYLARAQERGDPARPERKPVAPFTTAPPSAPAVPRSVPPETTVDTLLADEWRERRLTVLVTGATSGIGAATAKAFARGGHRLILTGRRVERLREMSIALHEAHDTSVRLLSYDVTDLRATSELLNTLPEGWRDIDVLVNNAGKAKGLDPIHRGRIEHWEEMIDTNVKGLLYMTRLVTPGMVERGRGHVINVCSTAGHEVYPNGAVYCATKHAVDAITEGTRLDLHAHGIRVSQVSPAHVEETEFARVRFDGDGERAAGVYAGFQPLRAADVARAITFIATQPPHVNVQDVLVMGTQQASSTVIDRSGR